jgi:hypothetical protein
MRESPSDYAVYFEDSEVASALAATARENATAAVGLIPGWESPYVSAVASSTADVIVRWIPDTTHRDWPKATRFTMRLAGRRWLITDAISLETTVPVPLPGL